MERDLGLTPIVIRRKQIIHCKRLDVMCTADLFDTVDELEKLSDLSKTANRTRHSYPKSVNRNDIFSDDRTEWISKLHEQPLINEQGETVTVPVRIPVQGQFVVIDGLHYVLDTDDYTPYASGLNTTLSELLALDLDAEQHDYLINQLLDGVKHDLAFVFGEHFTKLVPTVSGINFYKYGYKVLSEQGDILLNIGFGGKNFGIFFGLTGTGCKLADDGWEFRLYSDLLVNKTNARITRVDLAHDDLTGAYSSFKTANQKETDDCFMLPKSRIRPACTILGEFKHGDPQGKGLTLGIGSRANGKYFRGYEKGKQLGDRTSKWFRSELEIRAVKRLIPLDVLVEPTEYFAGAYPYCLELVQLAKSHNQPKGGKTKPTSGDLFPLTPRHFKTVKNEVKIALSRAIEVFKHQFGKYLKVFGDIFQQDNEPDYRKIYQALITDKDTDYCPKRLSLVSHVHQSERFGRVEVYL